MSIRAASPEVRKPEADFTCLGGKNELKYAALTRAPREQGEPPVSVARLTLDLALPVVPILKDGGKRELGMRGVTKHFMRAKRRSRASPWERATIIGRLCLPFLQQSEGINDVCRKAGRGEEREAQRERLEDRNMFVGDSLI